MSEDPFRLECDERACLLLIDGSWLDHAEPVKVNDDYGPVRLADDPYIRITLSREEAAQLWRLLDNSIGMHVREGEKIAQEVERTRREGLDTRVPSREEYEEALELVTDPSTIAEMREHAAGIATVYERAHGLHEHEGFDTTPERSQ